MAENTKIQWATHTFNPWRGCQKIAPGCANCYADAQSKRNPGTLGVWGPNGTRVVASEAMWREPVKWNKDAAPVSNFDEVTGDHTSYYCPPRPRPRVFCASLADVFEDWPGIMRGPKGGYLHHADKWNVRDGRLYIEIADIAIGKSRVTMADVRARLFRLWRSTLNLDWLVLTKRIENARHMLNGRHENLWLGTSIANQEDADRNIPELLKCRDLCAKLFLSIEPLIGPVMLHHWIDESGAFRHSQGVDVDWVIVGGESGPNARPCNVEWIRSIVRQCQAAGVPCFVKQLGAVPIGHDGETSIVGAKERSFGNGSWRRLSDPKGGDPAEWPEDLRVREVSS